MHLLQGDLGELIFFFCLSPPAKSISLHCWILYICIGFQGITIWLLSGYPGTPSQSSPPPGAGALWTTACTPSCTPIIQSKLSRFLCLRCWPLWGSPSCYCCRRWWGAAWSSWPGTTREMAGPAQSATTTSAGASWSPPASSSCLPGFPILNMLFQKWGQSPKRWTRDKNLYCMLTFNKYAL